MRTLIRKFCRPLRRFGVSEKGAATVELVIVFPFFIGVFVSAFEVAIMNMRAVMLERATDTVVSEIRLNLGDQPSYEEVLADVCSAAAIIPDCMTKTRIELKRLDPDTWVGISGTVDCVKQDEDIDPDIDNGSQNDIMMMRVCSIVDPIFPTIGVGRSIPRDPLEGGYRVIASAAFVIEPL